MKPKKKANKYAPLSPIIKTFKTLSNKINNIIKRIKYKNWPDKIGSLISPKFPKTKMTINEYEISNPFNPSIKLLPLIKISKQNEEKKYANISLVNNKSNRSILDEIILKSVIITNNNIDITWKKNLFFGETKIFLSEKKPIKKIILKKETKIRLFRLKKTIGKIKKKPPLRGIFPEFEKDWWLSPV